MSRVDAHLHFWRLARGDYHWLTPELAPLYRDFGPDDIGAALDAADVDRVVVVQAAATEAETCYLFELARDDARIAGVVGWSILLRPMPQHASAHWCVPAAACSRVCARWCRTSPTCTG